MHRRWMSPAWVAVMFLTVVISTTPPTMTPAPSIPASVPTLEPVPCSCTDMAAIIVQLRADMAQARIDIDSNTNSLSGTATDVENQVDAIAGMDNKVDQLRANILQAHTAFMEIDALLGVVNTKTNIAVSNNDRNAATVARVEKEHSTGIISIALLVFISAAALVAIVVWRRRRDTQKKLRHSHYQQRQYQEQQESSHEDSEPSPPATHHSNHHSQATSSPNTTPRSRRTGQSRNLPTSPTEDKQQPTQSPQPPVVAPIAIDIKSSDGAAASFNRRGSLEDFFGKQILYPMPIKHL